MKKLFLILGLAGVVVGGLVAYRTGHRRGSGAVRYERVAIERGRIEVTIESTGVVEPRGVGRPAELFRFRREVLRERRAPGVGLGRR